MPDGFVFRLDKSPSHSFTTTRLLDSLIPSLSQRSRPLQHVLLPSYLPLYGRRSCASLLPSSVRFKSIAFMSITGIGKVNRDDTTREVRQKSNNMRRPKMRYKANPTQAMHLALRPKDSVHRADSQGRGGEALTLSR
jgi:hypothetical protein